LILKRALEVTVNSASSRKMEHEKMKVPFYRTLKHIQNRKANEIFATVIAIAVKETLNHLKYMPESKIVKVNRSKMMLSPKKGDINTDLYRYRKREPICTEYLINSGIIKKDDVIIDIGANIGYYALVESQLVGKNGKVYAVEPILSTYNILQTNVKLNHSQNISTYQLAFGDKNAHAEIFVSKWSNLCAMSKEAVGGEVLGTQDVSVLTVDEFVKDKPAPNLVRMDVEGYEYEIIKGMTQTLKGKTNILLELHTQPNVLKPEKINELLQILENNNYRIKFIVYEHKVRENLVTRLLLRNAGDQMPIIGSNLTIQQLKEALPRYQNLVAAPNIYFEKI